MERLVFILQTALGIGLLIFVHELGHYLAARLARVRVEVFSLGFGPRIWGFRRGPTDYRLSIVPVGGYVRVAGEDQHAPPGHATPADGLHSKGFGARALFFSGGVLMNLLFAMVAFPLIFHGGVEFNAPVIGAVEPGGTAWRAGLRTGDRVLELDGKPMYSFENLLVETALSGGQGEPVPLRLERDGQSLDVRIQPRYDNSTGLYDLGARRAFADEPLRVGPVDAGSPAAGAGLREGDELLAIDGVEAVGLPADELLREVETASDPAELVLTVRRGEDPDQRTEIRYTPEIRADGPPRLGVRSAPLVVQAVRPNPAVDALGLRAGDRLLRIDGRPYGGRPIDEVLEESSGPLEVTVRRNDSELQLTTDLADARSVLVDGIALGYLEGEVRIVPMPDTPASRAGFLPGDKVLSIDGEDIDDWDGLVAAVHAAGDRAMRFSISRGDATLEILVTPEPQRLVDLGFDRQLAYQQDLFQRDSLGGAMEAGFVASVDLIKQSYVTLKRIVTGDVSARNLGGIVTISRVSYDAAKGGMARFFYFLALLSINLAFINVLPIPVLDGGHLLFLLIERIKGSPVSAEVVNYSQILGLVFVVALMVFVTYNDILRIL